MKQWESTLIGPDASLEEAISTLDKEALRIVMVVDGQNKLLGTLTDGDVRRALLKHLPLDTKVSSVMCSTPRAAARDWSRERILAEMEKHQLLQLPVLNQSGQVIGLENLQDLLQKKQYDNPVFLMAGGFGTRLRPLTHNCPKPLLKVGDKPILELILERFIAAGFHRFFISTHYMPEMLHEHFGDGSNWGVSIRYVHEEEPLGTGGALGLLPHEEIDLPIFMMNGDLLTTLDFQSLLEFHQEHRGVATMCVREYEHCVPYGVIQSEGHKIRSMVEKPSYRFFINAGIYLLDPELVKSVDPGTRIDMPTLLEQEIANNKDVNMFPVHEYWLDIGRMEDFQRAQQEFGSL
ncbi:nucleotidyltransferase family protein [Pseudomonas sp. Rh2]|uniref:nucleotidyltransferase family protein n=1 Tax=unclassified Pseudomonas TaxID=196821 RepID=UPI00345CD2B2